MDLDEKINALTMSLQLLSADQEGEKEKVRALFAVAEDLVKSTQDLERTSRQDSENIRALARHARETDRQIRETATIVNGLAMHTHTRFEEISKELEALAAQQSQTAEIIRNLKRQATITHQPTLRTARERYLGITPESPCPLPYGSR